jgi:hypothetical protein
MSVNESPDIKNKILHLLEEYRKKYIFNDTLATQDPKQVTDTIKTLEQKGTSINNYYNYPSRYSDKDITLHTLIHALNKVIEPDKDNPIYNILIGDYVDKLFIQYPLTPNPSHIYNNLLKQNAQR